MDQRNDSPSEGDPTADQAPIDTRLAEIAQHLSRICVAVQRVTGHDFARYKQTTLLRRIERRVQLLHADSLAGYVARLEQDPAEARELCNDFLISVTGFFRDHEVFQTLARQVLPRLCADKGPDTPVRVWVPGCATGEEAYTIAMLLSEQLATFKTPPAVQIFATDIDEEALATARTGRYPASIAEHIEPERLERFFIRQGAEYQISKHLREMCVFSIHNLVRDPPFSSLDLISCRNVLIYLNADLQARLVPLFQYALRVGGYLLLGPSEGLAAYPELFRVVSKKHRLFQRKDVVLRLPVQFPLVGTGQLRGHFPEPSRPPRTLNIRDIGRSLERIVLDEHAPSSVVINERAEIIYSLGETSQYLQQPTGATTLNIVEQARKGLRLSLLTAIHRAIKTRQNVVRENIAVTTPGGVRRIDLIVRLLPDLGEDSGLLAVVFEPVRGPVARDAGDVAAHPEEPVIQQLETELQTTREELQTTVEELEAANEELKSSNEELLSMNEEMQSANEELQTSKEELQSVNEEMETVNAELHSKVEALDEANADLQNLFRSTEIATLFLDRDLRIKRFTPAATAIFHLIDSDIGRPIRDFAPHVADANVVSEMREVLSTLATRERQVYLAEMRSWYMLRILPSRTLTDAIDGVVATFVDITALKQTEESLRESEQRFRTMADAIPQLAWMAQPDGFIFWYNQRWYEYTGTTPKQMEGWGWQSVHDPEILPKVLERWKASIATGQMFDMEFPLRGADGGFRWFLTRVMPLKDGQGRVTRWFGTNTDISEKREAEAAVRSVAQFPNENPSPVIRVDDDGIVLYANAAALALSPEWRCHAGQKAPERLARWAREAIGAGQSREVELPSGGRIFSFMFTPIAASGYVNLYGRDITEHRRAQQQQQWLAQQRQVALDAARMGWWHYDPRTRIATYDARYREIFGVTGSERPNDEILARLHPDDLPGVWAKVEAALDPADPRPYSAEYRIRHDDGSTRWVEAHGVAAFEGEGADRRAASFVGTVQDITQRKLWEETLAAAKHSAEQAQAIAESANKAKDHFLAILSHELRNPLNPVLATAAMLRDNLRLDADTRGQLEVICRNAELEALLIDDLLDMTRIERGKIELDRRSIDLRMTIGQAVEVCRADIEARRLEFGIDLPAEPCWIDGDISRLQQVFWNILKNAIKFTPAGGCVGIRCRQDGNNAVVTEVSDSGEGIDPAVLPRLFTAFEQGGRPTTRQFGGLGLGLAISRSLVEMHGGSIEAQSEGKGKGATFTVRLPLLPSPPAQTAVRAIPPNSATRSPTPTGRPLRILLVEDHGDSARIMRRLLVADRHEVQTAADVATGMQLAQSQAFDLLLSDLGLPDGTGWDLMRALRARGIHLPGIALSGYGQEGDIQQSHEAGFSHHIVKPVNMQRLRETIDRMVSSGAIP